MSNVRHKNNTIKNKQKLEIYLIFRIKVQNHLLKYVLYLEYEGLLSFMVQKTKMPYNFIHNTHLNHKYYTTLGIKNIMKKRSIGPTIYRPYRTFWVWLYSAGTQLFYPGR